MPRLSSSWPLLLGVLFALALSFLARYGQGRDHVLPGPAGERGWITTDADSHYQMRRVDRVLTEGLPVAGTDAYLNYPEGSAIPWPPYYTMIAAGLLAPFAPEDVAARRAFVEEGVASLPLLFGVLTTLMVCLAGALLAGRWGALAAGSYHALTHISVAYSNLGNGDHHSFVSFASAALLLLVSWVLRGGRLRDPMRSLLAGSAAGILLGVLLGSWLGSMVLLIGLELALAWMLFRQSKQPVAGLAPFGFAMHAVALLTLMPAVMMSPWIDIEPWMLVNLSYFHPAFLTIGAAVFLPLFSSKLTARGLRLYPWIVGAVLAALGLLILFTDLPISTSLREGFDWASKTNEFMAGIAESRSLFANDGSPGPGMELGLAFWLLPLAIVWALVETVRRGALELLPWIATALLAALQATQQARFAESLAVPLAVLFGWSVGRALQSERARNLPRFALPLFAVLLAVGSNSASTSKTFERITQDRPSLQESETPARIAARLAANWIARNTPESGDYSVLADWGLGHTIEWAGDRPSVATNFGSYVGEDGFRAPAQFFMEEDPARAEAILIERKARYVLLGSDLPDHLNSMIDRAAPHKRARWIEAGTKDRVALPWFRTMGARLMFDGSVFQGQPAPQLDFLRLVYISPIADPSRLLRGPQDASPAAFLWEHVRGAQVTCAGDAGETLRVEIELRFAGARRSVQWKADARVHGSGRATLRVPYATAQAQGGPNVVRATWSIGSSTGALIVPEQAVQEGATVTLKR